MAGNVTYMTGQQMMGAISAANQAVSGMTYAEAAAALGGAAQASEGGLSSIYTFPLKYQEYGQVSIEAQYAAQMWEYWKTVAGAEGTTVLGAAAGAAVSYARGALIGTGEGLAATAGILTVSVPTAVAMAAPLLGVGLGYALYETNPELWTRISDSVVGFCNKGSQTISALITEAGQILLPKGLVDSIKSLFEEEGIGGGTGRTSSLDTGIEGAIPVYSSFHYSYTDPRGIEYDMTITPRVGSPVISGWSTTAGGYSWIAASASQGSSVRREWDGGAQNHSLGSSYTYNNQTVYYHNQSISGTNITTDAVPQATGTLTAQNVKNIAWTMIYGEPAGGEYPDGTMPWSGKEVDPDVIGTWPAFDPDFGTTRPYYPVTLPVGDIPGTTGDPHDPTVDPTAPISPVEIPRINPYIPPVVNPEIQWPDTVEVPVPDADELTNPDIYAPGSPDPIYVPDPATEIDPAVNPSVDPGTLPDAEPVPDPATEYPETDGEPPQPEGTSPPIIFPVPDPGGEEFPNISPVASDTPVVSGDPGFVQVYHPTPSELLAFGRWLWVTYADATIDKIWNNPFDGVIGCHELYATPNDDGYTTIRCGFLDSGVSSQLVRLRYSTINCGSMVIPEYWGNYLDYSPYTKVYIYLPFIGIQELDADDIIGHAVNVCYHIDAYNGSCIAQITCAKDNYTNTLYQFSGNCAVEYPLSGGSQAAIKAAMMTGDAYQAAANTAANASLMGGIGSGLASAVGGIAGGIATGLGGNLGGGIGQGIGGIASGIGQAISGYASAVSQRAYGQAQHTANMLSGKSIVQHSGNFGASYGAMGIKKPYIFVRRPIQKVINNYNILYGYPAHKQVIIGNCTGFLRCREVHVISPIATDNEKMLIEQLLTTGVYVTDEFSQLNS